MLGQSNMLGEGHIGNLSGPPVNHTLANAVKYEGKYPYLYDKATKNWTTSKTVRNVFVMGGGARQIHPPPVYVPRHAPSVLANCCMANACR